MFARNWWNSMCDRSWLCCFGASFLQTAKMHILMLLASSCFLTLAYRNHLLNQIWTLFLLSHKYEFPHRSIMRSFWGYCLNWLSWFRPRRVCSAHRKRLRSSRPRTGRAPILTETSGFCSWVSQGSQGRPQVVAIFLTSSLGGSSPLSQKNMVSRFSYGGVLAFSEGKLRWYPGGKWGKMKAFLIAIVYIYISIYNMPVMWCDVM